MTRPRFKCLYISWRGRLEPLFILPLTASAMGQRGWRANSQCYDGSYDSNGSERQAALTYMAVCSCRISSIGVNVHPGIWKVFYPFICTLTLLQLIVDKKGKFRIVTMHSNRGGKLDIKKFVNQNIS